LVPQPSLGQRLLGFASPAFIHAQTLTTLHSFSGTDGANPEAGLLQANGTFYGTTAYGGGTNGYGTVFEITAAGVLTTLHTFDITDGWNVQAGLVQFNNSQGDFFGTTFYGGPSVDQNGFGYGTVFEISPTGELTTSHNFAGTDGQEPRAGLVRGANENLYGTTQAGGVHGLGTVFEITPAGALTTLHSFGGTDGDGPGALIQASNGNLYGVTYQGGANNDGTIFEITPTGVLTTLHSFDGTDGEDPFGGLVQANNGNLYGTTYSGGTYGAGTVFEITPAGKLTVLHSFNGTDGESPAAALIQASDGNFYGTASGGGASNLGTVFKITAEGALTTLHSFSGADGSSPGGALTEAAPGLFYGTAASGGADGYGTVFMLVLPPVITSAFATSTYAYIDAEGQVCQDFGTSTTAFCSRVWNDDTNGYLQNVNGQAAARANAGSIGVESAIGTTEITPESESEEDVGVAGANAYASDTILVSSSVPVSGVLAFSFTLAGQGTTIITGDGFGSTYLFADLNGTILNAPSGPYSIADVFNVPFATNAGTVETGFFIGLSAGGGCTSEGPVDLGSTCSAVADYYDTLQITALKAVDANGNLIPGVTLTSASGYSYNPSANPTSGSACNGTYNGTFTGDILVSNGQQCEISGGTVTGNITVTGGNLVLDHATVGGDVHIHDGGTFVLESSTDIEGNLHIRDLQRGTAQNRICGVTVKRGLHFHDNGTGVEIGSSTSGCVGNSIGGDLEILNNGAPVQVFDNTVGGDLRCLANASITGSGNTAEEKQGQCSKF